MRREVEVVVRLGWDLTEQEFERSLSLAAVIGSQSSWVGCDVPECKMKKKKGLKTPKEEFSFNK